MARTVAQWMRQREKSKCLPQGKKPTMMKERIQKLNKIDYVCSSIQVDDWRPQGKKPTMTKERIQKLNKIGSGCSIPVQVDDWRQRNLSTSLLGSETTARIYTRARRQEGIQHHGGKNPNVE
jgi:hypothetical protein